MALVFEKVPFCVIYANYPMIAQHWHEVAEPGRELNPNWDFYYEAELTGRLACFVALDGEKIVGYTVFFLQPDLHSRDVNVANNIAIFLLPEYRKDGNGRNLIRYCDDALRELKADVTVYQIKPAVNYAHTLRAENYDIFATAYIKHL